MAARLRARVRIGRDQAVRIRPQLRPAMDDEWNQKHNRALRYPISADVVIAERQAGEPPRRRIEANDSSSACRVRAEINMRECGPRVADYPLDFVCYPLIDVGAGSRWYVDDSASDVVGVLSAEWS